MKRLTLCCILLAAVAPQIVFAMPGGSGDKPAFRVRVVASGLQSPHGIATGPGDALYFTEVPTPGVSGSEGGSNGVKALWPRSGKVKTLNMGEPEPLNLTVDCNDNLYWTCSSAGVILRRGKSGEISPLLAGLDRPTGIATDGFGNIYYTELPTPGVSGANGGFNTVNVDHGDAERILNVGDPAPYDIAIDLGGYVYWTCATAGVLVERDRSGETRVLLSGLSQPMGIAIDRKRSRLYFTEVPNPGVSGADGGQNKVWGYDLETGKKILVNAGDPAPTDVAVADNGNVYWTCTSAGVIVEARPLARRW